MRSVNPIQSTYKVCMGYENNFNFIRCGKLSCIHFEHYILILLYISLINYT